MFLGEPLPVYKQNWPLDTVQYVSVRVLTYNHQDYISDCIDSILNQVTTFPVKIIVFDDCSSDNTSNILRDYLKCYPHLFHVTISDINTWGKSNRKAIKCPYYKESNKAKYIAFCEGDDYWIDYNKLEKQVSFLDNHNEFVAIGSNYITVDKFKNFIKTNICQKKHHKNIINNIYEYPNLPKTLTKLVRNINADVPILKTRINNGDELVHLFYKQYGKTALLTDVTGAYRKHDAGVYSSIGKTQKTESTLHSLKVIKNEASFNNEIESELAKKINKYQWKLLFIYLLNGEWKIAKSFLSNNNILFRISALHGIVEALKKD